MSENIIEAELTTQKFSKFIMTDTSSVNLHSHCKELSPT